MASATKNGITLLFKAHHTKSHDHIDFESTWPRLRTSQHAWLMDRLRVTQPHHPGDVFRLIAAKHHVFHSVFFRVGTEDDMPMKINAELKHSSGPVDA